MPLTNALRRRAPDYKLAYLILKDNTMEEDLNALTVAEITARYNKLRGQHGPGTGDALYKFRNKATALEAFAELSAKLKKEAEERMKEPRNSGALPPADAPADAPAAPAAPAAAPGKKHDAPGKKRDTKYFQVVENSRMHPNSARSKVLAFLKEKGPSSISEIEESGIEGVEAAVRNMVSRKILEILE